MAASQIDDTNNIAEAKRISQEVHISRNRCSSNTVEQMRLEQARMVDWICIFLIFTSIMASSVSFCITKSMLSFSFLSLISLLPSLRRRKEEAIFPISGEDLQIKLKELDVEHERIKLQNKSPNLPLFTWLRYFIRKRSYPV